MTITQKTLTELDRWYKLKEHPVQDALVSDDVRFKVVPAGRRCLEKGTMVCTPKGSVPIEVLKVGDYVIGINKEFQPEITIVLNTFYNGIQEVIPLLNQESTKKYVSSTKEHSFLVLNQDSNTPIKLKVKDFTKSTYIKSIYNYNVRITKGTPYLAETYDITVGNELNLYCLHEGGLFSFNSGKTERAKRYVVREAMKNPGEMFFVAAPTREQTKIIFWKDIKLLSLSSMHSRKPLETDLIVFLDNGATIHHIGLDKPERMEGSPWAGGIIDEIANVKPIAWKENIRPALDTYNPTKKNKIWCWLIGVPEGFNHYYKLDQYAKNSNDPEWKSYSWHSSDILPPKTIEAAKRQMSKREFQQEYEAAFTSAKGRIYGDYSNANHTNTVIMPHEQLCWTHDQNYTPLSSAIAVRRTEVRTLLINGIYQNVPIDCVYFLDEIVLESAISQQSALEFVEKFKDHQNKSVIIYGDPAGRAGEKHGHVSDYIDIENVLRQNGWNFERKVKNKAPSIKNRQNAVRAKIANALGEVSLYVNPAKAPWCDEALNTVQYQLGSTFQEDQKNQYQHISTAIGYFIDYEYGMDMDDQFGVSL